MKIQDSQLINAINEEAECKKNDKYKNTAKEKNLPRELDAVCLRELAAASPDFRPRSAVVSLATESRRTTELQHETP